MFSLTEAVEDWRLQKLEEVKTITSGQRKTSKSNSTILPDEAGLTKSIKSFFSAFSQKET